MRRNRSSKKLGGVEAPLIAHRDIFGKAFAMLLIFALAMGAFYLALRVPPRLVERKRKVVNALEADGGRLHALPPDSGPEVKVRGLDYLVPRGAKAGRSRVISLDQVREMGLLRGYSLPPRRLAFTPDGNSIILPPSPEVTGPRDVAVIYHGNREKKRVALTFDTSEVSEPRSSLAIIEELARLRAPATLFVCGGWCRKNPELLRVAVDRGFEIASHSYSHPMFTRIPNEQIASELRRTEEAVREITGSGIAAYFRPPYGDMDARVQQVVASLGYAMVIWDRDTLDWHPATIQPQIRDRATAGACGGNIVLMHTMGRYTPDALVEIVNNLRAGGYELTTLSGVLQP